MSVLIVDGVTGAGKSSVLSTLLERREGDVMFIREDDTLGDLMTDVRDPVWRARPRFDALALAVDRIEEAALSADHERHVLVERLHLTAFALYADWSRYDVFDARLRELGAVMVLLTFPEHLAEARSIERPDREGWGSEMDDWYGSRAQAVQAVIESQRLRREGLLRTRLPFLQIDTRDEAWDRYAATIDAYWRAGSR